MMAEEKAYLAALGTVVRRRRMIAEVSLSALAREAGITKSNLSKIERGQNENPGVMTMRRIAHALDSLAGTASPEPVPVESSDEYAIKRDGQLLSYRYPRLPVARADRRDLRRYNKGIYTVVRRTVTTGPWVEVPERAKR